VGSDQRRACRITYNFSFELLDLRRLFVSPSVVEVTHCGRKGVFAEFLCVGDRLRSPLPVRESAGRRDSFEGLDLAATSTAG
jgi:hypothetical protein